MISVRDYKILRSKSYNFCVKLNRREAPLEVSVSIGVILLPVPAVADHFVDAEFGFPAEFGFGFGGVAKAGGDVTGTTGFDAVGHIDTVHADEGVDHVEDAVTVTRTYIVYG